MQPFVEEQDVLLFLMSFEERQLDAIMELAQCFLIPHLVESASQKRKDNVV